MPVTINGSGSITGLAVGGLPDGCVDTDTIANSAVTSAKTTLKSGITMYDKWVGASTTTGRQDPYTNWVRHSYSDVHIATGMSHSSGIFTFPQTGIYLVRFNADAYNTSNYERIIECSIEYTTNNSSYSALQYSMGNVHNIGSYNIHSTVQVQAMFDVVNVSTHKVRFIVKAYNNESSLKLQSYSAAGGFTYCDFTRVADT
tara:strand:+ start:27 stop:629 length:603 start_codon:yes stop_codon:yes gene_type:complete